jgi:hypothetical protein
VSSLDLSRLAPADAEVALRSFPRRYRAELASGPDDDSADELANRVGPGGMSALDVTADVTRTWGLLDAEMVRTLTLDDAVLHPAVSDPSRRHWDAPTAETVDDALDQLDHEATGLVESMRLATNAVDWTRTASVAGGGTISALDLLKEAVRVGADGLEQVQRILVAVRR